MILSFQAEFGGFGTYPNQNSNPHALCRAAHPRFGVALSKCRSRALKTNRRMARRFLKDARKSSHRADTRKATNNLWLRHAKLESIIEFLSQ